MAGCDADKVVYLTRSGPGRGQGMPYRVELARQCCETHLVSALRRAMERADDALHARGHGALRDGLRGGTVEACRQGMRQVRLHRHDMEEVVRAGLEFRFTELLGPARTPFDADRAGADADPLPGQADGEAALAQSVAGTEPAVDRAFLMVLPGLKEPDGGVRPHPVNHKRVLDLLAGAYARIAVDPFVQHLLLECVVEELQHALPRLQTEVARILGGDAPESGRGAPEAPADGEEDADAETRHSRRAVQGRRIVEEARERVTREIQRCLEDREPPRVVQRLLEEAWSRVLFLDYLHNGVDSEVWVRHCTVMERLLWSFEVDRDPEDSRRLVMEIPLLLHELGEGLSSVLYDPFEMNKLLRALEAEHLRCLSELEPDPGESWEDRGHVLAANERESHLRRLRELPEGTWFEIETVESRRTRVRLAGVAGDDVFVFANRAGFKVLERRIDELAEALLNGRAEILDDHRLFNAGLSRVVRRLRERCAGHDGE